MNVNINLNELINALISKTSFQTLEIEDGFDKFLLMTRHTKAEATHGCYRSHAKTVINDLASLGIKYFNEIDDKVIFQLVDLLRGRGCKNSTINKNIELLIRCYQHLAKLGFLPNQEFQYQHLKESLPDIVVIDEKQLKRIIEHTNSLCSKSKLIILLLLCTGMRRAELARIRIENINLKHNRIYLSETKCGGGRTVFYDPSLNELIVNVMRNNQTFLFEDEFGCHASYNSISMIIKRVAAALNIPKLSPHKFRHTYATMLLKNGANIGVVQKLMGHSSLSVTHRYLDFTSDELNEINTVCNPLAKFK